MFYDEYFMKIAKSNFGNMSQREQHERELIERVQKYNDGIAMMELVDLYRGIISSCITESGITAAMDYNTALSYATTEFRKIIKKNINLSKQSGKISTSVYSFLKGELLKRKNENMNLTSRMSTDLTLKAGYISAADEALKRELGRIGNNDETYNYITKTMGLSISKNDIAKIRERSRKELSGDRVIGGKIEGADVVTLSDLTNVSKTSGEDEYKKFLKEQSMERVLSKLSRKERRVVMQALGLGEFKGRPAKNANILAIDNGMTNYEVKKVLKKYEMLKKSELIE